MLLSLHVNKIENDTKTGVQLYVNTTEANHIKSNDLAEDILYQLRKNNLYGTIENNYFYALTNKSYPALLSEMGNLNNAFDRNQLSSENGRNTIAKLLFESLLNQLL